MSQESDALEQLAQQPGLYLFCGPDAARFSRGFTRLCRAPIYATRHLPVWTHSRQALVAIGAERAERAEMMCRLFASGFYADAVIETGRGGAWVRPRGGAPFRLALDDAPPEWHQEALQRAARSPGRQVPPPLLRDVWPQQTAASLPSFITGGRHHA